MKLTEARAREEFIVHFLDLKAAMDAEGERVDKRAEWQAFLILKIKDRHLHSDAIHWACPPCRPPLDALIPPSELARSPV